MFNKDILLSIKKYLIGTEPILRLVCKQFSKWISAGPIYSNIFFPITSYEGKLWYREMYEKQNLKEGTDLTMLTLTKLIKSYDIESVKWMAKTCPNWNRLYGGMWIEHPMDIACKQKNFKIIEFLCKHECKIKSSNIKTAIRIGDVKFVKELLTMSKNKYYREGHPNFDKDCLEYAIISRSHDMFYYILGNTAYSDVDEDYLSRIDNISEFFSLDLIKPLVYKYFKLDGSWFNYVISANCIELGKYLLENKFTSFYDATYVSKNTTFDTFKWCTENIPWFAKKLWFAIIVRMKEWKKVIQYLTEKGYIISYSSIWHNSSINIGVEHLEWLKEHNYNVLYESYYIDAIWRSNCDVIEWLAKNGYKFTNELFRNAIVYYSNDRILDAYKSMVDCIQDTNKCESLLETAIRSNQIRAIEWLAKNNYKFPPTCKIKPDIRPDMISCLQKYTKIENLNEIKPQYLKLGEKWDHFTTFI